MKKVVISFIIVSIAFLLGCGEADTVLPGDDLFYNTRDPEGDIISIKASVSCSEEHGILKPNPVDIPSCYPPTAANPIIIIDFDTPVAGESIIYDTTITVSIWDGNNYITVHKNNGTNNGYYANPTNPAQGNSHDVIRVDLRLQKSLLSQGAKVKITLTSGIKAYGGDSVTLSNPGDFEREIQ
jgi:hypothetical protein